LARYAYGVDTPVRFIDINGDSLWIGQDRDLSFSFLQELHPELARRLSLATEGLVVFNTDGLDLGDDASLDLMNNWVNGGSEGKFAIVRKISEDVVLWVETIGSNELFYRLGEALKGGKSQP
jgi:hypothetical protein